MNKILTLAGLLAVCLLFVYCATVDQDSYQKPGSDYAGGDGWYEDKSTKDMHLMVNGSSVFEIENDGNLVAPTTTDNVTAMNLHTDKVSITTAEMIGLRAANKQLVAAPGANKMILVESIVFQIDYGSAQCTESDDDLGIMWGGTAGDGALACATVFETTGSFVVAAADSISTYWCDLTLVDASADVANKAIMLDNDGDGEIATCTGSTFELWITYRILDIST